MTGEQRGDPAAARRIIDSVFDGIPAAAKASFHEFFATAIEHLSTHHPDRWGVTLFDWGVRLNAGSVECLVLHAGGLRINVEKDSAPGDTEFDDLSYPLAPGCEFTTVQLGELPHSLPSLLEAHLAALSIAAGRKPPGNIRRAHSAGVTALFSLPDPSYVSKSFVTEFDEEAGARLYSEGRRCSVLVNRFERDPAARAACIFHYGVRCSVCGMSFQERYGQMLKEFIHVHHLVPLSQIGTHYRVNPIADLRPVCPNCHAVIHRCDPPLSIEAARALLSD